MKTGKATVVVAKKPKPAVWFEIYKRDKNYNSGWLHMGGFSKLRQAKEWAKEHYTNYCIIKMEFPA